MKILLISYDNDSHLPFFPINLFYLTGHLKKRGHQVGTWFQDIHHGRDDSLIKILADNAFDIVGLGATAGYYQYRKLKELSEVINSSPRRPDLHYVLGGHGPAGAPEYFLKTMMADSVIVGDGEDGLDQIIINGARGVIDGKPWTEEPDLPTYHDFPLDLYRMIRWPTSGRADHCFPILSSRGCKWSCSFCYRMRHGFHMRPVEGIIEEIKFLMRDAGIRHFQFADELLMASEKRTAEVCEAILSAGLNVKWDCNGRLNFAKPGLLKLMKQAGCEYVNYGIESLDQKRLNKMGKGLTIGRIYDGVRDTLKAGLSPGLNLIWGFPGETVNDLWAEVDFLKKFDPCDELRTIRPVTPYPGCRLYQEAIEKGLLEGPEDFYERKHMNSDLFTVNFMDIPDDEAHRNLYEANVVLSRNYLEKRQARMNTAAYDFYVEGKPGFRGWRAV